MCGRREQRLRRVLGLLAFGAAGIACGPGSFPETRTGMRVEAACPSDSTVTGLFAPGSGRYGGEVVWEMSVPVHTVGLAPLWCGSTGIEAYRLVWERSRRSSVVVELLRSKDGWSVVGALLERPSQPADQYPQYTVANRVKRAVTSDEAHAIVEGLEAAGIWSASRTDDAMYTGGAWMVEGRRDGAYQLLSRSGGPHGAIGEAALRLIALAGLDDTQLNARPPQP